MLQFKKSAVPVLNILQHEQEVYWLVFLLKLL